jgi:hypothetical protein
MSGKKRTRSSSSVNDELQRIHGTEKGSLLLPRSSSRKVFLPPRLRWAALSIKNMVHELPPRDGVITDAGNLNLTDSAMHALVLCHERFLQALATEMVTRQAAHATARRPKEEKRSFVQISDVDDCLNILNLTHIIAPARASLAKENAATPFTSSQVAKKKLNQRKKKKEWSLDELEAQEKLLAHSKTNMQKRAP